jgi:prepilin-type N-terminal cleavage/methylation domain-containing protein
MVRRLASDQRGFTLTELLVAMPLGLLVTFAAFEITDKAFTVNASISAREDALQRGRQAMEQLTQRLRSQVCLNSSTPPMVSGDDNSVTFYANLGSTTGNPQRRTITYSSATRKITEDVFNATGSAGSYTFPVTPSRTRTLIGDAYPVTGTPFLRYYAYPSTGAAQPTQLLPSPLTSADRPRVTKVSLAFVARATAANSSTESTTLQNDVVVRQGDATDPNAGVVC